MSETTLLAISGIYVPPYSARGIIQSFAPIEASAVLRRTINGALEDVSDAAFRKYRTSITCRDQQHPALNGVWPGLQVTVDCVSEFSFHTATGSAARTPVTGSTRTEGAFTFYRPKLTMRVVGFSVDTDEYAAYVGWTLDLEEV